MSNSVVMISGADYAERMIVSQAKHLSRRGNYRLSVIGISPPQSNRADGASTDLFDRIDAFPRATTRPRSLAEACNLVKDLALVAGPYGQRLEREVGPYVGGTGATLRTRLWHRLQWHCLKRKLPQLLQGHALIHWHTMDLELLPALNLVPPDIKIVLTPWGSDLLRTSGVEAYARQYRATERATFITVASLEAREILLSKFGRALAPKVRMARFGTDIIDMVDAARQNRSAFRSRYDIPEDNLVVCVGHSSDPANQHLAILHQISKLGGEKLSGVTLVLPMTYGQADKTAYIAEVRALAKSLAVDARVFDTFMAPQEVAEFRAACDVMIHLPISDMFAAAMSESLYAGGVLITAAWLPYSPLRGQGVYFHELASIDELSARLAQVLDQYPEEKRRAASNKDKVRALVGWDRVASQWLSIYEEGLN